MSAPAFESDRDKFFRLLMHDDRRSFYVISSDASGAWADTALTADALSSYQFDTAHNYYVTHNGFTGRRRLSVRTRQLNALFFDLDCHEAPPSECERLIRAITGRLSAAVQTAVLPKPTMIVDSGRGVHVYYVLDRSVPYRFKNTGEINEPGISFFHHVQSQLANLLDELLADVDGVKVDRAVFDTTRVSRIPNTYNTKARRHARLVFAEETFHSLSDLNSFKAVAPAKKSALPHKAPNKRAVILKYDRLLLSRLNKIAELQEYRKFDCRGTRERMCFVYYNTAVQIYRGDDAWDSLMAFNARFNAPLAVSELEGIRASVSKVRNIKGEVGYYVLSASKVIELLALTDEEIEATHFFASKRMVERMEAKRKTKERRAARDERIVGLYKKGGMTQQQVANEVGCSPRTVYVALKSAGLTGKREKAMQAGGLPAMSLKAAARKALDRSRQVVSAAAGEARSFSADFREILANVSLSSAQKSPFAKGLGLILALEHEERGAAALPSPYSFFDYGPRLCAFLLNLLLFDAPACLKPAGS